MGIKKKIVIERDSEMYHTLVRLLVEVSESLRKDFTSMSEGNSYSTVKRVRKHLSNMRKLIKEMSFACTYKREKIVDAKWGGTVPSKYTKAIRKSSAESEPIIL